MTDNYRIETMSRLDLGRTLDWARGEGWNPGRNDVAAFHAADPNGFLMGRLDGQSIASISIVRYPVATRPFAFLGLYIVAPDWRGKGYGMALWRAAMARAEGLTVGLDGVVDQQANYAKSGFVFSWRNFRYSGDMPEGAMAPGLVPLATVPFQALVDYDEVAFGARRPEFLAEWIRQPHAVGLAALQDGEIAGYGVIRPAATGWRLAPLFADDALTAEVLAHGLVAGRHGTLSLDIPEPNAEAMRLAQRLGLVPVWECARMYTGPAPDLALQHVYAITSLELG